jgi:hypothetical protein
MVWLLYEVITRGTTEKVTDFIETEKGINGWLSDGP